MDILKQFAKEAIQEGNKKMIKKNKLPVFQKDFLQMVKIGCIIIN